jgi:hypothetical protein
MRSVSQLSLHHDAFVGLICGLYPVPGLTAALRGKLLQDCVDNSSLAWRAVADPLTNFEFVFAHEGCGLRTAECIRTAACQR